MASEKIVTESALAALASDAKRAIYDVLPGGSASGNPCTFDTDIAVPLKSLIAKITASGGNGTPATPNPIVGHSELNLVRCGKNLFDINGYSSATGWTISDNILSADDNIYQPYISNQIKGNGNSYTLSFDYDAEEVRMYAIQIFNITDNTELLRYETAQGTGTHTEILTLENGKYYEIRIFGYGATSGSLTLSNIMFELGSQATAYAPYNGTPYLVSFGQTVYGGAYDANRGKVHVTYGKDSFANKSWTQYSTGFFAFNFSDAKANANGLCEIYEVVVDKSYANAPDNSMQLRGTTVLVKDTSCADITALIARVGSAEFIYELATPIEIDVSELSVDTIVGTNNIVSDCGGDVEVEYRESVEKYVTEHGGGASWTDVVGTLTAGNTSITLSNAAIKTTSTIQVFTDPEVPYNTLAVSSGSATLTFDAQANDVSVKVRVT